MNDNLTNLVKHWENLSVSLLYIYCQFDGFTLQSSAFMPVFISKFGFKTFKEIHYDCFSCIILARVLAWLIQLKIYERKELSNMIILFWICRKVYNICRKWVMFCRLIPAFPSWYSNKFEFCPFMINCWINH